MFGFDYEIVKEYPNYYLDYQEKFDESKRWTDRIASGTGEWSGNIYDFYFRVYNKLTQNIKIPFELDKGSRVEDTDIHKALREAIANCLINADYYGRQGIVIVQSSSEITVSNPGGSRVELEAAKAGGVSDPRNATLMKFFNLIGISERAGSGIQNIYSVWKKQGFDEPLLCEETEPERTIMKLFTSKNGDKKTAIKKSDTSKENSRLLISFLKKVL